MGQTGPHRQLAGYGPLLQGLAGFVHLTGWPDKAPVLVDRSYPDMIAPRYGVAAVIAALDYKRRTGQGQYIDLAQYETCIHWLAPTILDYTANRRVQGRTGNKHPSAAPHGAYRCQGEDRWCAITVFTDLEWAAFCNVICNPPWTKEEKFKNLLSRKQNEEELNERVEEWTVDHKAEEVMSLMQQAGVRAGAVQTVEDVVEKDPQLKHRHFFWKVKHPEMGEVTYVRPAYLLSGTPAQISQPSPVLGQHTEHVCKELLGLSEEEYSGLLVDNVFY
jgi:benzylsuccinate CoA-transferase BbsF subunit